MLKQGLGMAMFASMRMPAPRVVLPVSCEPRLHRLIQLSEPIDKTFSGAGFGTDARGKRRTAATCTNTTERGYDVEYSARTADLCGAVRARRTRATLPCCCMAPSRSVQDVELRDPTDSSSGRSANSSTATVRATPGRRELHRGARRVSRLLGTNILPLSLSGPGVSQLSSPGTSTASGTGTIRYFQGVRDNVLATAALQIPRCMGIPRDAAPVRQRGDGAGLTDSPTRLAGSREQSTIAQISSRRPGR